MAYCKTITKMYRIVIGYCFYVLQMEAVTAGYRLSNALPLLFVSQFV